VNLEAMDTAELARIKRDEGDSRYRCFKASRALTGYCTITTVVAPEHT